MDFGNKKERPKAFFFVLALPIFPVRLQTSIVGRSELNFRVRNGNGWTLALISTNLLQLTLVSNKLIFFSIYLNACASISW